MSVLELPDGEEVEVRPVQAGDKDLLRGTIERMSPDSRYRRFFHPVEDVHEGVLAYLTEIDHRDHEALVALEPGTGEAIGVARFVRSRERPDRAEVAVAVVDDWQGRRLGRGLLERLAERARDEDITCFTALVQSDNRRAVDVLSELGVTEHQRSGTDVELLIALPSDEGLGAGLAAALRGAAASALRAVPLTERVPGLRSRTPRGGPR